MNFPRLFIKDKHPLIDFAYYGSKARRAAHPDVLLGGYTECPMFREGDILDANAVLNLVKCVRWNEWASLEKLEKHIEDTVIHVTQEDRDRWDNVQQVLSDWNELDDTSYAYIKNKPDVYTKNEVYTKTIIDLMLATKADTSSLSNVATSGDYNDLINKPTIPTIPTNVSAFVNDAGYLTEHQDISGKLDVISDLDTIRSGAQAGSTALQPSALNDYYNKTLVNNKLSEKQDTINDLATIRTGAGLGATALQPSALDNYYNKSQVDNKLDSKQDTISNLATIEAGAAKGATSLQPSDKGVANGVATLNENGIIPSSQLPSYVDDVLEYESSAEFPVTGESGKIYVDLFTNKTYRWGGSGYVEISQSLALGETSSTAYAGDKGKATTDAFNAHAANTDIHVTAAKQAAWDAKADVSYVEDNYLKNYIETDPTGGHDYVEIGGIKWATMNIGAESIADTGLYFQWGDTQGYTAELIGSSTGLKHFDWSDYKYCDGASKPKPANMTKYNPTDGKTVLDPEDDGVTVAWGSNWRMFTSDEFETLVSATNISYHTDYLGTGIGGTLYVDKTDSSKTLFFPDSGYYWQATKQSSSIAMLYTSSLTSYQIHARYTAGNSLGANSRGSGIPIRGIYVGPDPQRIPVSGATEAEKTSWNNKSDFSGSYNDLTDKPTIPTVPTNVSAFTNDAGYLTQHQDISGKADKSDLEANYLKNYIESIDANGHGYVDLGLPSGLLWCDRNVGAVLIKDRGSYFSWGNVVGHDNPYFEDIFYESYYNTSPGKDLTGNIPANSTYDAARANMGGNWRMPTGVEFEELRTNCNISQTTVDGLDGFLFTSNINSNSIFFPFAGYHSTYNKNYQNTRGYYWSSDIKWNSYGACMLLITDYAFSYMVRWYGATVRGVLSPNDHIQVQGVTSSEKNNLNNKLNDYIEVTPLTLHDYVEIGGIKWATMNVGAQNITDSGLYFQWADNQGYAKSLVGSGTGKKLFYWSDYKYNDSGTASASDSNMTKYNASDGKFIIESSDDGATATWGSDWRIPSIEEYDTLLRYTTGEYVLNYQGSGIKGYLLTDKTDNTKTLFFPAAGYASSTTVLLDNSQGYYWSNELYYRNTHNFLTNGSEYAFSSTGTMARGVYGRNRCDGFNIRAVYIGENQRIPVQGVTQAEKDAWNASSTQQQADWNQTDTTAVDYIKNKPTIPVIPTDHVDLTSNQTITGAKTFKGVDRIILQGNTATEKPGFAINTSTGTKAGFLEYRGGDKMMVLGIDNNTKVGNNLFKIGFREYSSYSYNATIPLGVNKNATFGTGDVVIPIAVNGVKAGNDGNIQITIPAAQVNADWSANSGVALILNKPTLATVATSGSYNDLSNKPTIPSIWTGTQALYDAITTKDPDTIYIITSTS